MLFEVDQVIYGLRTELFAFCDLLIIFLFVGHADFQRAKNSLHPLGKYWVHSVNIVYILGNSPPTVRKPTLVFVC